MVWKALSRREVGSVVWVLEVRVGHLCETLFECSYFNAAKIWAYLSVSDILMPVAIPLSGGIKTNRAVHRQHCPRSSEKLKALLWLQL